MKVFKNVLIVLGLLVVAGAIGLLVKNVWDIRVIFEVASANKSTASITNPTTLILIGSAGALLGGFFLGFGLGMPRRSRGSVSKEAIEKYKAEQIADKQKDAAKDAKKAAKDKVSDTDVSNDPVSVPEEQR